MSDSKEVQIKTNTLPVASENESQGAMTSFIERAAVDPNVDIDKFERLIALQNSENERRAKIAFDTAMSNMQGALPAIQKMGKIVVQGTVRSTYAKFEHINEAVKPHLRDNGFSISFRSNFDNSMLLITGILSHKSGHREENTMRLPFDVSGSKNNVQAIGSSVSYGQRYVLCMLLNISTSDDNDGGPANLKTSERPLTQAMINTLKNAMKMANISEEVMCKKSKVEGLLHIKQGELQRCISWLQKISSK